MHSIVDAMLVCLSRYDKLKNLHMLINQHRVAVGVNEGDVSGAGGGFVGFFDEGDAGGLEGLLDVADVGELIQRVALRIPAGIEGQGIFFKHALEKTDDGCGTFEDEEVLGFVAADDAKAQRLIKGAGRLDVLDGKAD